MSSKLSPSSPSKLPKPGGTAASPHAASRRGAGGVGNVTPQGSAMFLAAVSGGASRQPAPHSGFMRTVSVSTGMESGRATDSGGEGDSGVEIIRPADKRPGPSVMGFGRRKDQEIMPSDIPSLIDDVKVDVYVRCRPMSVDEIKAGDKVLLRVQDDASTVIIKAPGHGGAERFHFDHAFSETTSQEDVYKRSAKPIVDNVLRGMNCCMFAYGQTGTGKTYTMVGDLKTPEKVGIIPRAVQDLFEQLIARGGPYKVTVSFLEVYNEQLMDLLIAPEETRPLRLVEDPRRGVICQNLTEVPIANMEEAMALLAAGNRRCQVASTAKNDRSNRAHRVFIVSTAFNKAMGAALRDADDIISGKAVVERDGSITELDDLGCLTIVDLAGSECVGRSGATDVRLLEASNINKSLLTLGRVINALANNEPRIPYRDSKLTRLTAEALGGRCKTAIIATVAPGAMCSVESASTLKYAERARSALNSTQLSKTQVLEAKLGRLTQLYKELQLEFLQEREYMENEKQELIQSHALEVRQIRNRHQREMRDVIRERNAVLDAQMESMRSVQRSEAVYLRSTRKTTTKIEADVNKELASLTEDASALHEALKELANIAAEGTDSHVASMSNLVGQLSSRLKALSVVVKDQMDRTLEALQRQDQALREFAQRESDDMKKTAEDMIKSLAKLLSKHVGTHSGRVEKTVDRLLSDNKAVADGIGKFSALAQTTCSDASTAVTQWGGSAKSHLVGLVDSHEKAMQRASQSASRFADLAKGSLQDVALEVRDMYTAAVHHHAMVDAEARKASTQVEDALRSLQERRTGSPGSEGYFDDVDGPAQSRSVSPPSTNSLVSDSDPSGVHSARSPDHSPDCGSQVSGNSEVREFDEGCRFPVASDLHLSSNSSSTNPSMPTPTVASKDHQPLSSAAIKAPQSMDISSHRVADGLMALAQTLVDGKRGSSPIGTPSVSPVGSTISIGSAECAELMNFESDMNP